MKLFAIQKPQGTLASIELFTNRKEAAYFAVAMFDKNANMEKPRKGKDGSDLNWKKMKREGWSIVKVNLSVVE